MLRRSGFSGSRKTADRIPGTCVEARTEEPAAVRGEESRKQCGLVKEGAP